MIISQVQQNLPSDKIFVMPNYKLNRPHIQHKDNIYYVKTNVSDLKDEQFSIVALEVKNRKLEIEKAKKIYLIIGSVSLVTILVIIILFIIKKKILQKVIKRK